MKTNHNFGSFANKALRRQAVKGVDSAYNAEKARMGEKFYFLDHTAEVLENYRKIQENKIFDRLLHDERQKKAFLKNESRKIENLLHDPDAADNQVLKLTDKEISSQARLPSGVSSVSSTEFTVKDFLAGNKPTENHSHFRQYEHNKKEIINLGIERMLADTTENDELQRYLDERNYETASLGETSADEVAMRSASDLSDSEIDIYQQSEVSTGYKKAQKLSSAVKDYEIELVKEHLGLDLYRAKGKSWNKISFKDLSLHENLNYIKYTLKNAKEAFHLFNITRDSFCDTAEIPAAIV